jgi:hypothetical protein
MRPLGFSKIRLLPKRDGFRTIMNLKRRQQVVKNGVISLGRSINTVMTPVFNVLTYERVSTDWFRSLWLLLTTTSHFNLTFSAALCSQ